MKVEQQRRHAPWAATYEVIQARYAEGTSVATIARQLGISRPTVYTYLRRDPTQSAQPSTLRARIKALHAVPDPPLARAQYR
jgi:IS30 family transposase